MLADQRIMIIRSTEILKRSIIVLFVVTVLFSCGTVPKIFAAEDVMPAYGSVVAFSELSDTQTDINSENTAGDSTKLLKNRLVYPGGFPFGVKMYTDGLMIVGFADIDCNNGSKTPAKDAGMQVNDIIIMADEKKITSANDFIDIIERSKGRSVKLVYLRNDKKYECDIIPSVSSEDGKYKTGMWLRDSTAGIGTVTFIVPESGLFAGLGHGICDSESGALVPLSRGVTSGVAINGIKKGKSGSPGELKGSFKGEKTGNLFGNTDNGVFGIFTDKNIFGDEKILLAKKDDLKDGEAYILCTLDDNKIQKFTVEISEIHKESEGNKNFIVTVTDKRLIEKTGGIVQGMSGSPIIQNGKLMGAVTHVLINDPTKGYGIFADNMITHIPESLA